MLSRREKFRANEQHLRTVTSRRQVHYHPIVRRLPIHRTRVEPSEMRAGIELCACCVRWKLCERWDWRAGIDGLALWHWRAVSSYGFASCTGCQFSREPHLRKIPSKKLIGRWLHSISLSGKRFCRHGKVDARFFQRFLF